MKIVSAIKWAVKGDSIATTYRQETFIADYGSKNLWKVYSGTKIANDEKVAMFILLKAALKSFPKDNRTYYVSAVAKSINLLHSLQHYSIINILTPFTETKESYAFVTEPIIGTLDSLINQNNLSQMVNEDKLKYGIMSLADGFNFFHYSQIYLQCLTPSEILITPEARWKIGGALYASTAKDSSLTCHKYYKDCMFILTIQYGYISPENLLQNGSASVSGDVFTFGSIIITTFNNFYPNGSKKNPLVTNDLAEFESELSQIKFSNNFHLNVIPNEIKSFVKLCLDKEPTMRPLLTDLQKSEYFNNININTMKTIDNFDASSKNDQKKFLLMVQNIINKLSPDTVITFIIPMTLKYLEDAEYSIFCLKLLISSIKTHKLGPSNVINLSKMKFLCDTTNTEILSLLIENFGLLSQFAETNLDTNYSGIICRSLESSSNHCRSLAIESIKSRLQNDRTNFIAMYHNIIPSIGVLLCSGDCALSIQINAFVCVASSIPMLEYIHIDKLILPILLKVTNAEVAFIMAYLGLVQTIYNHFNKKMDSSMLLTKLIPIMCKMCMHPDFNQKQVTSFKKTIYVLMDTAFEELMTIRPEAPDSIQNSNQPETISSNISQTDTKKFITKPDMQSKAEKTSSYSTETTSIHMQPFNIEHHPPPIYEPHPQSQKSTSYNNFFQDGANSLIEEKGIFEDSYNQSKTQSSQRLPPKESSHKNSSKASFNPFDSPPPRQPPQRPVNTPRQSSKHSSVSQTQDFMHENPFNF